MIFSMSGLKERFNKDINKDSKEEAEEFEDDFGDLVYFYFHRTLQPN